jgi:hypothetical protein
VWAGAELVVLMDAAAPVDRTGNHGLAVGGAPAAIADGPFGAALAFAAGDRLSNTTDSGLYGILTSFDTTIEVVARRVTTEANRAVVSFSGADDWILYLADAAFSGREYRVFWRDAGGNILNPVSSIVPDWAWSSFTTRANTDHEIYLDGQSLAQSTASASGAGPFSRFCIGDWLDGSQPWDGDIQAVIVWKTARSDGWIATGYASQSDPASFVAVGTPETAGGGSVDLAISDAAHVHAAGGGTLRQDHRLAAEDALQEQTAAAVALGQGHALWPAAGAHAEFAEIVSFDGAASLAVAAAGHGHHAGLAGLAQFHRLAIAAGWHWEWAAAPALSLASTGAPGGRTAAVKAPPSAISIHSDTRSRPLGAANRTLSITSSR